MAQISACRATCCQATLTGTPKGQSGKLVQLVAAGAELSEWHKWLCRQDSACCTPFAGQALAQEWVAVWQYFVSYAERTETKPQWLFRQAP